MSAAPASAGRARRSERAPGAARAERHARWLPGGLRARLVTALVATSVVTLGVAAATLLAPLERRLTDAELDSVVATAVASRPLFADLGVAGAARESAQLRRLSTSLGRRTGSRVMVFVGRRVLVDTGPVREEPPTEAPPRRSLRHPTRRVINAGARPQGVVALPVRIGGQRGAIVLRKSLGEVSAAVTAVERAVTVAALAGLITALCLGLALATALVRRLRRLRDAAGAMSEEGFEVEAPEDASPDELGELSRSLASMQRRLRELEEARRSFVSTASHELRTPLTALRGMLELLEEDLQDEPPNLEDARARAGEARAQVRRLGGLADELLELSRLDAGVSVRREPLELGELCRAVMPEFAARRAGGGPAIRLEDDGSTCWALGDPGGVARIVRILVDNALRFSPGDAEVQVECATANGAARVTVADSGPGVKPEERELIFERFRRGTTASGDRGFGLGLAIGRELAERMGGELTLEDTDRGAAFTLALPRSEGPGGPSA